MSVATNHIKNCGLTNCGDRAFFERVSHGYEAIALAEPSRVRRVDAAGEIAAVQEAVWRQVEKELARALAPL